MQSTLDKTIETLSGGLPRAKLVINLLICHAARINRQIPRPEQSALQNIIYLKLSGHDIIVLYRNVCRKSLPKMLAIMHTCQNNEYQAEIYKDSAANAEAFMLINRELLMQAIAAKSPKGLIKFDQILQTMKVIFSEFKADYVPIPVFTAE